jgi:hypothetical protein
VRRECEGATVLDAAVVIGQGDRLGVGAGGKEGGTVSVGHPVAIRLVDPIRLVQKASEEISDQDAIFFEGERERQT